MDKLKKQGSRIAELIDKGREQGYLTYADVNDHLPEDISDPDQVDEIIGMINDLGLQVHETAPDADTLIFVKKNISSYPFKNVIKTPGTGKPSSSMALNSIIFVPFRILS